MSKYTCQLCKETFTRKDTFIKHQNRMKKCVPNVVLKQIETLQNKCDEYEKIKNTPYTESYNNILEVISDMSYYTPSKNK